MDGLVRSLSIGIGWDIDNKGLTQANRQTDGLINNADRAEDEMDQLGRSGKRAGNKISRAFGAAGNKIKSGLGVLSEYRYELLGMGVAGAAGIYKLTSMAGNVQEEVNKMGILFDEHTSEAKQWANEYSDQINRSKYDTISWLNEFQGMLVPLGMTREEATGLSKDMVQLAADLGSLNNVETPRAINAMKSAMIGNHEAMDKLNVQLTEGNLNQEALAMGYKENFAQLDPLVKAQVRYSEILEQSQVAMGNAAETSDDYNNQILGLKGNLRDLGVAIGNTYIPSMTDGLSVTNDFLSTLTDSEWTKPIARFGGIFTGLSLSGAFLGTLSKLGVLLPVLKGAGLFAGIGLAAEDIWTYFQGGESMTGQFIENLNEALSLQGKWNDFKEKTREQLIENPNEWWTNFEYRDEIQGWWDNITTFEVDYNPPDIKGLVKQEWNTFTDWWDNKELGLNFNPPDIKGLTQEKWNGFTNWWDNLEILNFKLDIPDIKGLVKQEWNELIDWWEGLELDFGLKIPNIQGLINEQLNKLPEPLQSLIGIDNEEIEKDSKQIQKNIDSSTSNDHSTKIDKIEINVNGSDNPMDTARAVEKKIESKLETFIRMQAGEAGV